MQAPATAERGRAPAKRTAGRGDIQGPRQIRDDSLPRGSPARARPTLPCAEKPDQAEPRKTRQRQRRDTAARPLAASLRGGPPRPFARQCRPRSAAARSRLDSGASPLRLSFDGRAAKQRAGKRTGGGQAAGAGWRNRWRTGAGSAGRASRWRDSPTARRPPPSKSHSPAARRPASRAPSPPAPGATRARRSRRPAGAPRVPSARAPSAPATRHPPPSRRATRSRRPARPPAGAAPMHAGNGILLVA